MTTTQTTPPAGDRILSPGACQATARTGGT